MYVEFVGLLWADIVSLWAICLKDFWTNLNNLQLLFTQVVTWPTLGDKWYPAVKRLVENNEKSLKQIVQKLTVFTGKHDLYIEM